MYSIANGIVKIFMKGRCKMEEKRDKGKPRAFETEEIFKSKFMEYLEHCKQEKKMANIAGFCAYNWITRETFYKQQEYYSDTFNKIQEILEDTTLNADINDTFRIFYLKNKFDYKDKTEVNNNNVNFQAQS